MIWVLITLNAIILILAIVFSFAKPKDVNYLYGYRTKLSMKNQNTWRVANDYWTRYNAIGSVSVLFVQLAMWFMDYKVDQIFSAACILFVLMILSSMIFTQRKLKNTFNEKGNFRRKSAA